MWIPDPRKLVKVRLQDGGKDIETPWAEVVREVGDSGEVEVRLGNVPFLHAKPTYEDVIRVRPDPHDGMLTWDRGGALWEEIGRTIQDDSGRWAMIIDWKARGQRVNTQHAFEQLDRAAALLDVAAEGVGQAEGAWRAYLAVPKTLSVEQVLNALRVTRSDLEIVLVHPKDDV